MALKQHTINRLKNTYGNWALVTGATSGIGEALATQLAEAGFNLVVTGRREAQLQTLCTHFFDKFGTEAVPIAGDLATDASIELLLEQTAHLPLGIVILNAGFGTSGTFVHSDMVNELNMIDLNCKTVMRMSHHFANQMIRESRKGALVLLSSMVAFQGVPNAANYAATKAYVQSLGEGLHRELKPEGIDVLCASPGPVDSGFSERANMRMGKAMSAKATAGPILKAIGRKNTVLPGTLTKFLVYNLRMVPRTWKIRIMEKVMAGFTKHQKIEQTTANKD